MKNFIIFLSIFLVVSCKNENTKIKEGYIEYEVTYLNKEQESLYSFMLPKTMIVTFNKHRIKSTLNGFSGNFNFSIITNTKSDSSIALFQIMNKKYYYLENKKGPSELFGKLPGMDIQFLKDTINIANFNCKKATIESSVDSFASFDVYYTKKIKIHNANKKNPFYKIDGVLMDFYVNLYNMDMHFTAKNVVERDIPSSEFKIPSDYKRINRKTVDKIICMLE